MGTLYVFVNNLSPVINAALRVRQTSLVLEEARWAIIGYALQLREAQRAQTPPKVIMYGYLPLPDLGTTRNNRDVDCPWEGCDAGNFDGADYDVTTGVGPIVVGRFPWRTLGTGPLRDADQECLWLIVSSLHNRILEGGATPPPMNWDTLGDFDVFGADGTDQLVSLLDPARFTIHDRPIAIVFSPGSALSTQDRSTSSTDTVSVCNGNYDAANYLDPKVVTALGTLTNYLSGTNQASDRSGDSNPANDPDPAKNLSINGRIFAKQAALIPSNCEGSDCLLVANDLGHTLTSDKLFDTARKYSNFRFDVNGFFAKTGICLDSQGTGVTNPDAMIIAAPPADKSSGKLADIPACSASSIPSGYYDNYREQLLVSYITDPAACKASYATADACFDVRVVDTANQNVATTKKCHGVLLLGDQRASLKTRASLIDRTTPGNYLEGINLESFTTDGSLQFSGAREFLPLTPGYARQQDIVRCIPETGYSATNPTGARFQTISNPILTSQLTQYDQASDTLTLGKQITTGNATDQYGCAWSAETHALDGGLRTYFQFRINDAGTATTTTPLEGFTFAMVDGDKNDIDACGAARQHLGYSGNNTDTATAPFIKAPKIGFEVDLRRNGGFSLSNTNTLSNGRNDPSSTNYPGGHTGIIYWGGESRIATTITSGSCNPPLVWDSGVCYLPEEEDDNVHGYPVSLTSCRSAPLNPVAPTFPTQGAGVYRLNTASGSTPVNQDFHVRVEVVRASDQNVIVADSATNISLASPGATIGGVAMVFGDKVKLSGQTTSTENGVYVWRGASSPLQLAAQFVAAPKVPALPSVRLASTTNVALDNPGNSLDGTSLAVNDLILLKDQTNPTENGIYSWTNGTQALQRARDFDTADELGGAIVQVLEGRTLGLTTWRQAQIGFVVGSQANRWTELAVENPDALLALSPITDQITFVAEGATGSPWHKYDGSGWNELSVRVATQFNIDLSNPPADIDGCLSLSINDRVLVKAQSASKENGIYVWNGVGTPMTRASDADSASELAGAITYVMEGTDTGRAWRQTSMGATGRLDPQPSADGVIWVPLDRQLFPRFSIQVWILADSATTQNQIDAMKDTTRPMRFLYPGFNAHLADNPAIYYPFRRARLGFTIGQRVATNDQTVTISNTFTTWLN